MPRLPAFEIPRPVARLVARLPAWPPALVLSAALDAGTGRIVPREPVEALTGRRFALVVRDLGLTVRFERTPSGFRPSGRAHAPHLTVSATLRDFIALALREEDPDTLFFARRLAVEGDTGLGLAVKNLLDGIDWPAVLARLPLPFLARSVPR